VHAHFEFVDQNPDLLRIFHQVRGIYGMQRPRPRSLTAPQQGYLDRLARMMVQRTPTRIDREFTIVIMGCVAGVSSLRASARPESREARRALEEALASCVEQMLRGRRTPAVHRSLHRSARTAPRRRRRGSRLPA